jgi:hypothetical protein
MSAECSFTVTLDLASSPLTRINTHTSDGACWNAKVLAISQLAGTDSASNLRPRPYGSHAALVPMNLNLNRAPLISSHIRVRVQVACPMFCTSWIVSVAHFKHADDNVTYISKNDWPAVEEMIQWLTEKQDAGYKMVNSNARLWQMVDFMKGNHFPWNCRAGQNSTWRPGTCSIRIENSPGTSLRCVVVSASESPVGCKALRSDLILLTAALSCPYYE